MILLEFLSDCLVHITELASVTFIEYDNNTLVIDFMGIILFDECCKFLNGSDNDTAVGIFKLFFQNCCGSIAVGSAFFKAVILTHCLIVEVFTVNHEQYLVDIFEF